MMTPDGIKYLFMAAAFASAAILGMILIPNILFISYKKKLFDEPDARKVHKTPVPRLGGLSFFPAILIALFLNVGLRYSLGYPLVGVDPQQVWEEFLYLFSGLTILYLIGEADDLVGVGYRWKFLVQIIAAGLLVISGNWLHSLAGLFGILSIPMWAGVPITIFVVVFITNAINLIDGIDGLASGLCSIALAILAALLVYDKQYIYATLALVTLGIVMVFWFYNVFGNERKGHKLFMGDAGSLTLGYILSYLVIHLSIDPEMHRGGYKFMIIAFSTLLVPMLDVVRVSLHRIRKHRSPFLPDKNHIHHKLIRAGMKVPAVLVTILFIDLIFIGLNTALVEVINVTLILIIDVVLYTVLQLVINHYIKKNHGGPSYVPTEELAKSEPELAKELGLDKKTKINDSPKE